MDYKESGDILKKVPHSVFFYEESLRKFNSAKKARKTTTILGISEVALFGLSITLFRNKVGLYAVALSGIILAVGDPISGIQA